MRVVPASASSLHGRAAVQRGDFSATRAMLMLVPLAALVGALGAGAALLLVHLIGLVTNLVYAGTWSTVLTAPSPHAGVATALIPVAGGLVIGLMAKYGSERIRGHGIPEAMETILVGGSRIEPRLAVLKPISSAISIGTGGPFGAEGPIILTGGALGSIAGQFLHLTSNERRSLLVAGAAAGMSAVFGTPVAAVMLGVELLLFEWRPRSVVLVGTASTVAAVLRMQFVGWHLMRPAPLFPIGSPPSLGAAGIGGALVIGLAGGVLAWVLTEAVYGAEDAFGRLPLHWAWWPAIGGAVIGAGGLLEPRALGVGYDTIGAELAGSITVRALLVLLAVKLVIWAIALGSGTSGGILAPILMMGAAMGAVLGQVLPGAGISVWALLGLAAALAGVTRSPFTAVIFAAELTHTADLLLPLLVTSLAAHAVSVLVLRRSILTEKVARRGFHVTREYQADPLEALFVREVMIETPRTVTPDTDLNTARAELDRSHRRQRLFPVISETGALVGVLPWSAVRLGCRDGHGDELVADWMETSFVIAEPTMTLRELATVMIQRGVYVMPVVDPGDGERLVGLVSESHLLRAHERTLSEDRERHRLLRIQRSGRTRRRPAESEPVVS